MLMVEAHRAESEIKGQIAIASKVSKGSDESMGVH
jgi:hypothetical protein